MALSAPDQTLAAVEALDPVVAARPPDLEVRGGKRTLRIAMIGTRGVPARYGGFETAIEEIGSRLADRGHEILVYRRRSRSEPDPGPSYRGMRLVTVPAAPVKQGETLSHALLSIGHQVTRDRADVAVVFNAANGVLLPLLPAARIPTVVNTDGIEWKRGKWGRTGRAYFRMAEHFTARWADALIADAREIQAYWETTHGVRPDFIPYGASVLRSTGHDLLGSVGVKPGRYHLVVARLEPENNVAMIVAGHRSSRARHPLVVVGGTRYRNEVRRAVESAAAEDRRVIALGPVWDQNLLDQLYANSASYVHGHSVGGTNPSLLRAMGAGAQVLSYDSPFNREVLTSLGRYFRSVDEVRMLLEAAEQVRPDERERAAEPLRERVAAAYNWDIVALQYLGLCARLAGARSLEPVAATV